MKEQFKTTGAQFPQLLDPTIRPEDYRFIDLSEENLAISGLRMDEPAICQEYIENVLIKSGGKVAYGGYMEKRNLYNNQSRFAVAGSSRRYIHLGVDLWVAAGTPVIAPINGRVHSFANNVGTGNYGPTLILLHQYPDFYFHSLYGHLSPESIGFWEPGNTFKAGELLGYLGDAGVNGGYAPHLHFQLIRDMGGYSGDYPGVCALENLDYYTANCPDPLSLLRL